MSGEKCSISEAIKIYTVVSIKMSILFHKFHISRSIFEERIKLLIEGGHVFQLIAHSSWNDRVRNEYYVESRKRENNKKRRKANSIGHILQRNCLLKHVTEGRVEGSTE